MPDKEQLKSIVSELYQVPAAQIGGGFALQHPRLQGSAGRGVLAAAIRRQFGIYVPATFSVRSYGELEAAVCGAGDSGAPVERVEPAATAEPPMTFDSAQPGSAVAVGVDIELLENLPEASDFWTSDFYSAHFTRAEIAYCARQENPRMHFAARWCAKEALVKCDARFRQVDPCTIEVALDADGRPGFAWLRPAGTERLPHAVSLTHTPLLAAAVVAAAGTPARGDR